MRPTVYLAGPITGQTYSGATDWRDFAKENLNTVGIDAFSPMRGKQYLLQETSIGDAYEASILSTSKAIMTRDFFDCQRCDMLMVNFREAERVSIGTCMEIAWAYANRKPVVLIIENRGNLHDHAMIREACGYRVDRVEDAISVCKSVLLP